MRCPSCDCENAAGTLFCSQCATALTGSQKGKERTGEPANRRKDKTGQRAKGQKTVERPASRVQKSSESAVGSAQSTQPPAARRQPLALSRFAREGERRQLTVMFCDLVGSTPLAEKLDPEDLRTVVQAYHELCATVINRCAGYIAQYVGDGVVVYFGYPVAHEDDVQRAVRAGLQILAELPALNTRLQPSLRTLQEVPLQLRIGIHTGLVVVGEIGRGERRDLIALGETPNLAARIQGMAAPDTLAISSATYQLTQGFFACLELGPQQLKGVSTPIPVYHVVAESSVQSRFEVALSKGLTPLVGREQEVGLLLERWEQAKEGRGQVVLVRGEPGIGKSRLRQVFEERIAGEPQTKLECRCSSYYQNSALYPVTDLLQRAFGLKREDGPQEKLSKLERTLARHPFALQEVVPLFAALLSVPLLGRYPPLALAPQKQRQKTLDAVVAWLLEMTEKLALRLVVEDLHWADPSTLELLGLLIDQAPTVRIFLVLTARPEFRPPWAARSHLTHLTLSRLPRKHVEEMVKKVAGDKTLPAEVVEQVVAKTDGIPLFVEELTKMVLESGLLRKREGFYELTGPLPALAIPTTLHDSLMARLDRLGTAKAVAQLGATLGREFMYELLQAVSLLDDARLQRELAQLVGAELLYQRGLPPQARYMFKHALVQGAAYESLLKSRRQQYHQQIARVLEERFPETVELHPELLAHHYTEAGLSAQAIPCWQKAGQRAIERSANLEAVSHLTKGLELLKILPDTPERTLHELMLQVTLGGPLMATKGYAAPEIEKAYTRALELCQVVGDTPQLFPVLWGVWAFYLVRAEHTTAYKLAERLRDLAERQQDPSLLLEANIALGNTRFFLGEFAPALEPLEQGIACYDPQQHHAHAFVYAQDPGVVCLCYSVWTLWFLGYPEQALQRSREALTLAQKLSHPYSLAFALSFATQLHRFRGEVHATHERAEALLPLSTEHGFALTAAIGTLHQGWALVQQGHGEEGIVQLRHSVTAWEATGARLLRPYLFATLAEAYEKSGRTAEGLQALTEAFAAVDDSQERAYEAELYRLKGELLLQSAKRGTRNAE